MVLYKHPGRRPETTVVKTYLSQKPKADSSWLSFTIICLLFLCSYLFWNLTPELTSQWIARPETTFSQGQYWQLLTSVFIHADFKHFLANAAMLAVLNFLVCGYYGLSQVLLLMIPGGVLVNLLTLWFYPPQVGLLGISGVAYALAGFWLALYLTIDRRRPPVKRALRGAGFTLLVLLPSTFEAQTSYQAHAWGFAVGGVWGLFYFWRNKTWLRSFEEWQTETPEEDPYFFQ